MPEKKSSGSVWEPDGRQIEELDRYLAGFAEVTGASFTILIRANGDVLCSDGQFPRKDNVMISALAAAGYSSSEELSQSLAFSDDEETNCSQQFVLEGIENNIFISKLIDDILLVSVFSAEVTVGMMLVHSEKLGAQVVDLAAEQKVIEVEREGRKVFQFDEEFGLQVDMQLDSLFLDNKDS